MSKELDQIVYDIEQVVCDMGERVRMSHMSTQDESWYASISAQYLGLARRLRNAIEVERTELHEDEAVHLLLTYAAEDDAKLTESARALKHKLLAIADKARKPKQNHERFNTRDEAFAAYQKEHHCVLVDCVEFEKWLFAETDKDSKDNTTKPSEDIYTKVINAIDTVWEKHIHSENGLTVADEQTINLLTEIVHALEDQQKGKAS